VLVVAVAPHLGRLQPRRPVLGTVLLVEHLAVNALGVPLERERPVAQVRQQRRRDTGVVVDHLALGEAGLRPVELVEVGEPERALADADVDRSGGWTHDAGRSRRTSPGSTSSRRPLNAPARTWLARVQSANSMSATRRGSMKCARAGGLPVPNGDRSRVSGSISASSFASVASVKPVPI